MVCYYHENTQSVVYIMKKITLSIILLCVCSLLFGCRNDDGTQILATTKPVYQFTSMLCEGTELKVDLLVSENVSCLHDYTLQVNQMQKLESAEWIIINGAGFEEFLSDILSGKNNIIDSSDGIHLHCSTAHEDHDGHSHEGDPHIWLSAENGQKMMENIYFGLCRIYPEYSAQFSANRELLLSEFTALHNETKALSNLKGKQIITFHDGFSYLAESLDIEILRAIEEESGSEASAQELIEIIEMIQSCNLPAVFIETSSSAAAPSIIQAETGVSVYELDMALSERTYFDAMHHNINTLKEALK